MVIDCEMTDAQRSKNEVVVYDDQIHNEKPLFSPEELEGIDVIKKGENFIEVDCGCTNNKYGDSAGKLRIYGHGRLEIYCDCYPGCNAGMTNYLYCFNIKFKI